MLYLLSWKVTIIIYYEVKQTLKTYCFWYSGCSILAIAFQETPEKTRNLKKKTYVKSIQRTSIYTNYTAYLMFK